MQFSRVSSTKRGVELAYEKKDEHKTEETVAKSNDTPLPSFRDALQAFVPFVCQLLDLPIIWHMDEAEGGQLVELLTITTLNLSIDKNGNRGLIVTATKPVARAFDKPLVINTPLVRQGTGDDAGDDVDAMMLTDDTLRLIALVESEAVRYLNGEREQRELFEGSDDEDDDDSSAADEFDDRSAAAEVASTRKPHASKASANGKRRGRKPARKR